MVASLASSAHYEEQRRKAFFSDVLAILRKRHNDLLSYEATRAALEATQQLPPRLETIRVDRIVGSVGRYKDFTRAFLPRSGADPTRWQKLDAALDRLETLPPVEVYQIGDVYFVRDGHHRVSVARANGAEYIEATVIPIESRVPLTPEIEPGELDVVREYNRFLQQTNLDRLRPEQRIFFSEPGRYRTLLEHIAVHRYFMGLALQREIPYEEAVADWYDTVYAPIVEAIRRNHILDEFPGRTEADLYLWIIDHHYYLSQKYGPQVSADVAAEDFAEHYGGRPLARLVERLRRAIGRAVARLRRRA
jgi:hypothetical protein